MKLKSTLTLDNEFIQYCKLNEINDVEKKAKEVLERGFTLLKYGETPKTNATKETIKEIVVEKIVEVPVEVIKEVIVEKPIEIIKEIIKEVPVIKEVEVIKETTNNEEIERLTKENEQLKTDMEKILKTLDKFGRAKYMKNSDMSSLYDE